MALLVRRARRTSGWVAAAVLILAGAHAPIASASIFPRHDLAVWGRNATGALCDDTYGNRDVPTKVTSFGRAWEVAGGDAHMLALRVDSTLWGCGENGSGQLGDGTNTNSSSPVRVKLKLVVGTAAGGAHSMALRSDRTVWTWGDNHDGQLGDGSYADSNVPVRVPGLPRIVTLCAGLNFSAALAEDGRVFTWGDNSEGELGNGSSAQNSPDPVQVTGLTDVYNIACGDEHMLADSNNTTVVWAWGSNQDGQLGDPFVLHRSRVPIAVRHLDGGAAVIAAGGSHSLAIQAEGGCWAWGLNDNGQLGDGTHRNRVYPHLVKGLPPVSDIGAGRQFSMALAPDHTLWAWGDGSYGQLGNGHFDDSSVPVRVSAPSSVWTMPPAGADFVVAIMTSWR
jgi:alpha-tubulin suppressor-like RCC1 family protein